MDNLDNIDHSSDIAEELPVQEYTISHLVSANRLRVYIRIELLDSRAEVKHEDIMNYLSEQGIVYGIREENIVNYCRSREYSKELAAAQGKDPVNGKDAEIVYDFDISQEQKFYEKEDGTIDFKNLNNVINVTKDTVLCHIIPPQNGEEGIDVYGHTVKYKSGRNISFNFGNNTYVSEDGLQLLAGTDGCVKYKKGKVLVENVYRVNNVDNSTGNIDFIGNVIINGDVKAGFSVTAKGDIKIRGMVEGAFIESDGEVVISKGMNGMGKGSIRAKGNITSKYIENALIVSDRSIYSEALINSEVKAGESIILRGSTAAIIGGTSSAENIIFSKTIGSRINPETNVIINLTKYQEEQKLFSEKQKLNRKLEKEIADKNNELNAIEDKIQLIMNSSLDNENKNSVQKQLLFIKIKINNSLNGLKKRLTEIPTTDNIADHKIICKGIMYSNTRVTIGWTKYRVKQDISFSKLYNDGDDISIVPLNSSDIDI
jgi:hypothetical protein